ncbi:hypothetical protein GCM10008018_06440 [Paenibacillus marchantiophytorum]|uniref:Uncharacterized protein n=1 Tax=Paenibacillus marchantiophytorum TaxID=1619310 RepID=A0ABQ2BRD0_9BACL|nr:hypothetical protein [Paenibacillus marchantiophytorum]GGI44305.1 hypothetical protein GCM10008018_06440 [Paenibacillus marchantiophytorum]
MVKGFKNVVYMSLAIGMLFYSIPQLNLTDMGSLPMIFSVIWIALAFLVIASHLHQILGVDEEKRKELSRIKRMKKWQMEQLVQGRRKMLQFRK